MNSSLDEIQSMLQAWIDEREQLGLHPADPRRKTPAGHLRAPKFVNFHLLDPASDCDEIFWEGLPFLILTLPSVTHMRHHSNQTP